MPITVQTHPDLEAAARALASDRTARFLAGGTIIMRRINDGDLSLSTIVRTTDPGFREIRPAGSRISIGGGATMAAIASHPDLTFLHAAARSVGGPAVRQMATVGGNLFARAPFGDLAVALLALDATVHVRGGYSPREAPLEALLASRERGPDGIVGSISVDRPATPGAFRFLKVARVQPKGAAVITIAAHLPTSGGRIGHARVAYGGMAPTPIRARAVERALEGRTLDDAGIAQALDMATEGTAPATDSIASAWYRSEVAPVHLRRLLLDGARA
jgi:CO/xanthine dehydrogenase FAD-binding subunit